LAKKRKEEEGRERSPLNSEKSIDWKGRIQTEEWKRKANLRRKAEAILTGEAELRTVKRGPGGC